MLGCLTSRGKNLSSLTLFFFFVFDFLGGRGGRGGGGVWTGHLDAVSNSQLLIFEYWMDYLNVNIKNIFTQLIYLNYI